MRLRIIIGIGLSIALVQFNMPHSLLAKDTDVNLQRRLDVYMTAAEKVYPFQGAVLVAQRGKVIYSGGCGMANIELNVRNTPDMKFQIGSITKQFTAAAIMQLVEKGLINVSDPISKFLPDYPKPNGDKITIKHLLTNSSGTPEYFAIPAVVRRQAIAITPSELLATFSTLPLEFEPGTQFKYSNSGFAVLGMIIEKVSGEPYSQYIKSHIFDPLGMVNSGYDNRKMILPGRPAGYSLGTDGKIVNADYVDMSIAYAAGALYSTVGDMVIWDQALYAGKVLTKKSLDEMMTPFRGNYGYGYVIDSVFGIKRIWHNGGISGFHTDFERWPADSLCVLVFSNSDTNPCEAIARNLAAIIYKQPFDIPVTKKPVAIDTTSAKDAVGIYQVDSTTYRVITFENSTLMSQRTGGIKSQIFPEGKDKFYYGIDNSIAVTFIRDNSGKVISQSMHQMGVDQTCPKLAGPKADSIMAAVIEAGRIAQIDPKLYEQYAGDYQLAPQFVITIRVRDNRIFAQATGQPELEIFPKSESEYFWKAVDAQLTFVKDGSGIVTGLLLHQNGQNMPGEKIK